MLSTLLLTACLSHSVPLVAPEQLAPVASVVQTARVLTEMHDQGIGRGLRNMLIGGIVAGVGLGIIASGFILVLVVAVVGGLMYLIIPGLVLATAGIILGLVSLVVTGLGLAGGATLLAGGLWFAINTVMVLLRLNPDFKPGPATEYLDL